MDMVFSILSVCLVVALVYRAANHRKQLANYRKRVRNLERTIQKLTSRNGDRWMQMYREKEDSRDSSEVTLTKSSILS